jgi:hypothetical protein
MRDLAARYEIESSSEAPGNVGLLTRLLNLTIVLEDFECTEYTAKPEVPAVTNYQGFKS